MFKGVYLKENNTIGKLWSTFSETNAHVCFVKIFIFVFFHHIKCYREWVFHYKTTFCGGGGGGDNLAILLCRSVLIHASWQYWINSTKKDNHSPPTTLFFLLPVMILTKFSFETQTESVPSMFLFTLGLMWFLIYFYKSILLKCIFVTVVITIVIYEMIY